MKSSRVAKQMALFTKRCSPGLGLGPTGKLTKS